MNKNSDKRAFSVKPTHTINESQFLCEGCQTKGIHFSPRSTKKQKKKEKKCVSVKDPSRVTSFEASKVSSVRKPKQKIAKNPILQITEHQTPVLGKYFIAGNSKHPYSQNEQLQPIGQNHHSQAEVKKIYDESNLSHVVEFEQESTLKAPLSIKSQINRSHLMRVIPPEEVERQLDCTIDKLKSKQQTIDILNKTIHTRLVDAASAIGGPRKYINREDAYEVEMNFYVDKITLLQKELYEKTRLLKVSQSKNEEFSTLSRNTKKLIHQNSRLRQELELSGREITALKKLLAKFQNRQR